MRFAPIVSLALISVAATASADVRPSPPPRPLADHSGPANSVAEALRRQPRPADFARPVYATPLASGNGFTVLAFDARGSAPLHRHDKRSEVVHVASGRGTMRVGATTLALAPGVIAVIPLGVPHDIVAAEPMTGSITAIGVYDPTDTVPVGPAN